MSLDACISEGYLGEKYQSMLDEKIGKFSSEFDTTIESWFQDIAANSATGNPSQTVDYWQNDPIP